MIAPDININGTDPSEIRDGLCIAIDRIIAAKSAVGRTLPNGRDYLDAGALQQATVEHRRRLAKLDEVQQELEQLALSLCLQ
jgi:UDP-3-O-[3-hydroxymyristoyl] glucosamine N-acyltransferase